MNNEQFAQTTTVIGVGVKAHTYYEGLDILLPQARPDMLYCMAAGEGIPARFVRGIKQDGVNEDFPVHILISKIEQSAGQRNTLMITFRFSGELPYGVKGGTYTLEFEEGSMCQQLPPEMFQDVDLPLQEEGEENEGDFVERHLGFNPTTAPDATIDALLDAAGSTVTDET